MQTPRQSTPLQHCKSSMLSWRGSRPHVFPSSTRNHVGPAGRTSGSSLLGGLLARLYSIPAGGDSRTSPGPLMLGGLGLSPPIRGGRGRRGTIGSADVLVAGSSSRTTTPSALPAGTAFALGSVASTRSVGATAGSVACRPSRPPQPCAKTMGRPTRRSQEIAFFMDSPSTPDRETNMQGSCDIRRLLPAGDAPIQF